MDVAYNVLPIPQTLTNNEQPQPQQQQQQTQQQTQQQQPQSAEDDDNLSTASHKSSQKDTGKTSEGTTLTSESSDVVISQPPVSVRDMIKRYDTAAQLNKAQQIKVSSSASSSTTTPGPLKRHSSHHTLYNAAKTPLATSNTLNGINKFGSQTNVRQFVSQMNESQERFTKLNKELRPNWVKKGAGASSADSELLAGSSEGGGIYSGGGNSSGGASGSVKISNSGFTLGNTSILNGQNLSIPTGFGSAGGTASTTTANIDHLAYSNRSRRGRVVQSDSKEFGNTFRSGTPYNRSRMQSPDYSEETGQPQNSYQSRTTISKTSNGVRITIDIFFDQDNPSVNPLDVVGSRIETEIPQSRILNEFQEQSSAISSAPNSERF